MKTLISAYYKSLTISPFDNLSPLALSKNANASFWRIEMISNDNLNFLE
ncbi:hypothetical protein [Psychroserpens luteus]|uniref:Uncharacterized protein n=1 Tax=Psychroserpens luteus TaxID=1434066 RepID=A0ABW5ZYN2_9FLAO|nr:hypothetical protein [Psychroserpens luteus]